MVMFSNSEFSPIKEMILFMTIYLRTGALGIDELSFSCPSLIFQLWITKADLNSFSPR